jgi:hypothetical protein
MSQIAARGVALVLVGLMAGPVAAAQPKAAAQAGPTVQRIVIMRHGEKPAAGLGQLACKGLARAIALPDVVVAKFGKPDALFAPNPSVRKEDAGKPYDYIRPLATLEPLAIRLGLPVDVQTGFTDVAGLARKLAAPRYASSLVVVAWEHKLAVDIGKLLLKRHGGLAAAPESWKPDDFDRLDVIEITRAAGKPAVATYKRDGQGLDGLADECPRLPARK